MKQPHNLLLLLPISFTAAIGFWTAQTAPAPALEVERAGNSQVRLHISGPAGALFQLESSPDLEEWAVSDQFASETGTEERSLPTTQSHLFWRAVLILNPDPVPAPFLIGLPQSEAEADILEAGFTIGTIEQASSEIILSGNVMRQIPPAGFELEPGAAVDLLISSGSAGIQQVVGFQEIELVAGRNLLANPFHTGDNRLSTVLPSVPVGTEAYFSMDPASSQVVATFGPGGWDHNLLVPAGQGFFLASPVDFTVTFAGEVLQMADAHRWIPAGTTAVASAIPQAGALRQDLRFPVEDGDTILQWDPAGQRFQEHTYTSFIWIPSEPHLEVAEGFFVQTANARLWDRDFQIGLDSSTLEIKGFAISSSGVELTVTGPAGTRVVIEASPDALIWMALSVMEMPAGGEFTFIDAANVSSRFYRLLAQ